MESEKEKTGKPKNPRATANILSALFFSWTIPIFVECSKRDFEQEDLYEPLQEHKSSYLGDKLEKLWNQEVQLSQKKKKSPSMLKVVAKFVAADIILLGIVIFLVEIVLRMAQPIFLAKVIGYFSPKSPITKEEAYYYALGVVACSGLPVLMVNPYMMGIVHVGMKLRVAVCSLIYRKALRLSKTALGQTTVGQIVNLLSNDVNRFDMGFVFFHNLWIGPLQTILISYILWNVIGISAFVGIGTLLICIPLQGWLGKKASELRMKTATKTDERVRLMNEIISGIQVIKMYTWEKPFIDLVSTARRKEISVIRVASYMRGVLASFIIFHTRTAIFFSILSYVLLGYELNAWKVFIVISYFSTLRQTMTVFFPNGVAQIAEVLVSIKRTSQFLMREETTKLPKPLVLNPGLDIEKSVFLQNDDAVVGSIIVDNATAKWTPDLPENTLNKIDLKIKPGSLTAVIGPVGSGKTSLLHALLEELPLSNGKIQMSGSVSYASQEPWLFSGSVRQNILFGEEYDKDRYRRVVKVCSLKTDFQQFPYGDRTLVGDRGVTLSGGQRARINLARAVYKKADIYLLDDPLSAVDAHVSKHLFEDCISGFLEKSTVVLITHQVQFLSTADKVLLIENGSIKLDGTYQELQQCEEEFLNLFRNDTKEEKEEMLGKPMFSRQSSVQSVASSIDENQREPTVVEESRSKGRVGGEIYGAYFSRGGGWCFVIITLLLSFLTQFVASFGDYWITYWVNLEETVFSCKNKCEIEPENVTSSSPDYFSTTQLCDGGCGNAPQYLIFPVDRDMCIYIFGAITLSTIIIVLTRSFMFFSMCMKSSTKLHNDMFSSIIRATMHFFTTNPSGRILNRFSKDVGAIDELLPSAMIDCLQIGLALIAIITVVGLMNFWLLIPTFIAAFIFYFLRTFYLSTSRSVKRLEGMTRSPVFTHLNASIQGLTTIRAFSAENILREEFDNHQDLHSTAWYLFIATSRAFAFWLDSVCLIYIFLVTMSFLVLDKDTLGGNVGLAITQSIGLTGMFQWGMRQSAEVENQMTSVERVREYSKLESEPPLETPANLKPKPSWPEFGKIVFEKVFLRYSESEPWVLKNLNFTILPQQKVGIVGRTGAGKSSLISALFRLTPVDGAIYIDDLNTMNLGLHDLRSKIAIIPQEPVLFSGTLRKNLDPFDQFGDDILWYALEQVELKEFVSELPGKLSTNVTEGGTNLSVGQRQLVCLARAIIRNNKILVLDEATANVDIQTDSLIQTTIREKFASCTVLTIAHRLHTVMDSDKVLVMDDGSVEEFDHPHILLQHKDGLLSRMVQQTGKKTADVLIETAAKNYKEKLGSHNLEDIPLIDEDIPSYYGDS